MAPENRRSITWKKLVRKISSFFFFFSSIFQRQNFTKIFFLFIENFFFLTKKPKISWKFQINFLISLKKGIDKEFWILFFSLVFASRLGLGSSAKEPSPHPLLKNDFSSSVKAKKFLRFIKLMIFYEIFCFLAAVEAKDIRRIAERLLSSKPAVVGYGNVSKLPDLDRIEQAISKRDLTCLKPSRMFSFKK